jgi:hypothetical protein
VSETTWSSIVAGGDEREGAEGGSGSLRTAERGIFVELKTEGEIEREDINYAERLELLELGILDINNNPLSKRKWDKKRKNGRKRASEYRNGISKNNKNALQPQIQTLLTRIKCSSLS